MIFTLLFTIIYLLYLLYTLLYYNKKNDDCENINSVNPLYLMIHSATEEFKECDGKKYLVLYSTEKYEEVFSGIKKKIEMINDGKELVFKETKVKLM